MRALLFEQESGAIGCYRLLFPAQHMLPRHRVMRPHYKEGKRMDDGTRVYESDFDKTMTDPRYDADVYVFQQYAGVMVGKNRIWPAKSIFGGLHARGKPIVCDSDDDYVNPPLWNVGGTNAKKMGTNKLMMEGFREADLLTVSTPHLADIYAPYQPNVRVIRNRIHWPVWKLVQPSYDKDRRLRIGWVGSFRWRRGDLDVLRGVIGPWLERNPQVDFVSAGSPPEVHDYLGIPEGQRVTIPFTPFVNHDTGEFTVTQLYDFDIGLVPLAPVPFNDGKSHLKGLEMNAVGVPFIASPSESYRWYCDGENGILARKPKDWFAALDLLANDDELRRDMGRHGRRLAQEHDYSKHYHEWEDAWASVLRPADDLQVARSAIMYGAIQKEQELHHLIALARGKSVIVEIGSAAGGTMWAWSQVAADDALIISIDLPEGLGGGHVSHVAEQRAEAFRRADQRVHMIRGDSHSEETKQKLLDLLDGRRIELLFIDGDHTLEGVTRDWEMYGPLADTVAFHDIVKHTHPKLQWSKVDELWNRIKTEDAREYIFPVPDDPSGDWAGIGVIEKRQLALSA